MNHMSLFFIINLAILLSLNAKQKFYLVETDDVHSTNKYADNKYNEVLLENVKPSEISNDTDNSSEISKKGRRSEGVTDGSQDKNPVWIKQEGMDCYNGHGAVEIWPEPHSNSMSLDRCKVACGIALICEAIVRVTADQQNNGKCYLRRNLNVQDCKTATIYTLYYVDTGGFNSGVSNVPGSPGSGRPSNREINSPSRSLNNYTDCGIMGKTRKNRNRRVLGGEQTEENEIPWMCAILRQNGRFRGCGATLLNCNPVIIITAAHCVVQPNIPGQNIQTFKPQSLQVASGAHRMSANTPSTIDKNEVRLQVTDIVIHPKFTGQFLQPNGFLLTHDIAILKVDNSLPCSKGIIYPACLPTKGYAYVGWNSLASGWGYTSNLPSFQLSPTLQKIKLPIVSDMTCQPMCSVQGCVIATTQICAGGEQNKATCGGDSGGPLVAEDNLHQGYSLIGIDSIGPGGCVAKGGYNIFTEVSYYLDWIAEQYGLDPPK